MGQLAAEWELANDQTGEKMGESPNKQTNKQSPVCYFTEPPTNITLDQTKIMTKKKKTIL